MDKRTLRSIPPVDDLLAAEDVARLRERHPDFPWTHFVRGVVEEYRSGGFGTLPEGRDEARSKIVGTVVAEVRSLREGGMRRVINGTGVILHTNLGRAVVGPAVKAAVTEAMGHYVNLEVELSSGKRSHRGETLLELVRLVTQAEAALVVNNCAAAVYLVVDSYSPPGRIIVSRGELVEIGGSFRLPDILDRAAGKVIEVGTTNRTYIDDYAKEAKPGDILMKAHRSNYEVTGFTHEPRLGDLVDLAREKDCHVVYDLGSGALFDFNRVGLDGEETVANVVKSGVDCVMLSGDKLLGGVQAGIIAGTEQFMSKLGENPLRRTFRIDKLTIAAMQALLRAYLFDGDPPHEVPIWRQAADTVENLRARAERLCKGIGADSSASAEIAIVDDSATIGGGSFATEEVPSVALAIRCESEKKAVALAKRLRTLPVPILSRIKANEVRLNLRTVLSNDEEDLRKGLESVLGSC